ncbi:MAG: 23S rRNA (uracil(1939)-C(5))-methyltransferase RlmD [Oscillospiraceae bacterium]|nr:23S rRNA (uracil(1939)-C(5))-methyltransferase RlmD [Oscillospiraceae bacterium]
MAHPMKNKEYTVTITGCTSQGEGVAHLEDGLTVFIRGALTGEVCRISIMKAAKRCAWARLIQVISPSPARVQPDCPHYPKCGGCQSRHMSYQEELQLKAERVNDAFHHIGGLSLMIDKIHGAPAVNGYRNKVQFPVGGSLEEGVKVGFYRQRSHDVIPVEHCLLQPESCNRAGQIVREWMVRYQVAPYNEQLHTGLVRHVFCRENSKGDLLVCLIANGKKLPRERELVEALKKELPGLTSVVLSVNTEKTNVILGKRYRTLWGQDYLLDTLCSLTFRLSVPSFFQVNREQAQLLYERAVEFASLTGKETVLDLYCGTGTISQCMAKKAGRVLGAEIVPEAIEDAKANALRNGLDNTEFFCADAGEAAELLALRGLRPDVVSVDPPRKGLSLPVIEAICQMAPSRVVYVSCDPATLARDLKLLAERGYEPVRAEAVDMFPRTGHVETVCLLIGKGLFTTETH